MLKADVSWGALAALAVCKLVCRIFCTPPCYLESDTGFETNPFLQARAQSGGALGGTCCPSCLQASLLNCGGPLPSYLEAESGFGKNSFCKKVLKAEMPWGAFCRPSSLQKLGLFLF